MFESYLNMGIEHILDPDGIDHVLFLLVLTVPYKLKQWKQLVLLATAFTVGHSLTLALASLDIIRLDSRMVEIFIALSILITALFNIVKRSGSQLNTRYLMAGLFGLVHGLGFSGFFRSILASDDILLPLLAFNIGVEIAQVIAVLVFVTISYIIVDLVKLKQGLWIVLVSSLVLIWSLQMVLERI